MKKTKMFLLAGLAFCALVLTGCPEPVNNNANGNNANGGGDTVPAVDYTSHNDYSVMVKNNTSFKLVAFKGSPSKANLIGGIPADSANHKLEKKSTLFTTSQDFMLFIIKEEDYIANYNNLSVLNNSPFANIYAYYNSNSSNQMVYEISRLAGGDGEITVYNTSNMNVELRLEGPKGQTFGYVGDGMARTTFKVNADNTEYYLFPVFRKFNSQTGEIMTVFPKWTSGSHKGQPVYEYFELNAEDRSKNLYSTKWLGDDTELNPGYAYLQVQNGADYGVNFLDGGVAQVTSTGGKVINSNRIRTFQIAMPKLSGSGANTVYGEEFAALAGGFGVGTPSEPYNLPAFTYKAGYIYKVTTEGSQGDLRLSEITVVGKYDFINDKIIPITD